MKIKNYLFAIITLAHLLINTSFGQAPQSFNYQAVARDASGLVLGNQAVNFRISLLQGSATGASAYTETHAVTTNLLGLVNFAIGGGTVVSGNFATINWAQGPYFAQVELDAANNGTYVVMSTTQLLSVPYAMYANRAGSVSGITITSVSSAGDTLYLSNGQTFVSGGNGNLVLPTITTNAMTAITSNSATFGGAISNANGTQIMETGIVYSTSPNPTLVSNKIVIGNGIGAFDTISGLGYQYAHLLNPNTTYYVRAYAVTVNNISAYGNEVTFTTLSVGQTGPSGGIIFFDKGNNNGGWQYLESATSDQSTIGIPWGCDGLSIPGTQNTVGSGEANTALIVALCNDSSFAAKLCNDLVSGGQIDWFLPSRDELNLIYKNMHLNGQGNFNNSYYWSSTSKYSTLGLSLDFNNGTYNTQFTSVPLYVRAVRAF